MKEIAIRGEGLLQTPEYGQMTEQDFFVRSIVWTAAERKADGSRVEFESGFQNAEQATGFHYTIRGICSRKADGDFRKAKSQPTATDRTRLLRLVEKAAHIAMEAVVAKSMVSDDPVEEA